MRATLRSVVVLAAMLLAMAPLRADEAKRDCLPADLRLRVAFAEPKQLASALRALEGERKSAGKRVVLKRRFEEAGCARVEEQAGAGFEAPNLVCSIPGRSGDTIAIGSSPTFDGWPAAALLPEIARSIAAAPREHSYAIALLSRGTSHKPIGSRAFAKSFGERLPRLFVHVGIVGSMLPEIGPEAGDEQRCVIESISRALLGEPLRSVLAWEQVGMQCVSPGGNRYSGGTESLRTCQGAAYSRLLDIDPFLQSDVEVAGLYAYPKRDKTLFSMPERTRLDPAAYVASYRVLAAYSVALDALLGPRPAEPEPPLANEPAVPR
jgi:hypothetical protein